MTIYSWNMLYRNRELDRAFEFISHAEFDIFCLQEVPESFLGRLKTLPYALSSHLESEKVYRSITIPMYNVILSRFPLENEGTIPFSDYWPLLPWRTRLFINLMPSRFFARVQNRSGIYADLATPRGRLRVFNLHLALIHPALRLEEFERAIAERDLEIPTVICGDFNILESFHITPLNWILGGRMSDTFLARRERTHIESRFVEHKLTNALRGTMTHPLSRSQLDHILVSHAFKVENAAVLPDRTGSDHHPIFAKVV
jgi:endonuclease/exonuclease/phosphatase family metal-dependent hydrolase